MTSTAKNPAHTYTSPGRYTVSLTVTANGLSDSATGKGYIRVGPRDVLPASWAFDPIVTVWAADLVQGYPGGTYQPMTEVTRDQMAVYLARALAGGDSAVPAGPTTATFADVPADHWAYRYIEYLSAAGVVMGYPGGGYHPSDPVTREQMAVYISRAIVVPLGEAGLKSYVPPLDPSFTDVAQASWAYRYIEYAREHGVVQGFPENEDEDFRDFTSELRTLRASGRKSFGRFVIGIYVAYLNLQRRTTVRWDADSPLRRIPIDRFRRANTVIQRFWTMLGPSFAITLIIAAVLFRRFDWIFWGMIVVLNGVAAVLYLVQALIDRRLERRSSS